MTPRQPDLFGDNAGLPTGFRYQPDLIGRDEERALVDRLEGLPFKPFEFQRHLGKRRVVSFGWRYDFNDRSLQPVEPLPDFLQPLRARAEAFAGFAPGAISHALITEYEPGAAIGWHRDRPEFDRVVGISMVSPCRFRFRRTAGGRFQRADVTLEPRSIYSLEADARNDWEHSIPPVEALRYSITFRTLRARP